MPKSSRWGRRPNLPDAPDSNCLSKKWNYLLVVTTSWTCCSINNIYFDSVKNFLIFLFCNTYYRHNFRAPRSNCMYYMYNFLFFTYICRTTFRRIFQIFSHAEILLCRLRIKRDIAREGVSILIGSV